jgi:ferredoxin
MAYRINDDECISCGACQPVCPVECISEVADGKRKIDEDACIDCGACAGVCPVECIAPVE